MNPDVSICIKAPSSINIIPLRTDISSFVRSGVIVLSSGTLRNGGEDSFGESNSTKSYSSPTSATSYVLAINPARTYPSNSYNYYHGFPVRCLV